MITLHLIWIITSLLLYCVCNSLLLTGFFSFWRLSKEQIPLFKTMLLNTILSLGIAYAFFYIMAKMFCWTAMFMHCLECICWPVGTELFDMRTISMHILFFAGATAIQLGLIAIPKRVTALQFVSMVIASNTIATIVKIVCALVLPL